VVSVWPTPALVTLGIALVLAAVDWVAVLRQSRPVEWVAKPATLVAIIAGAWLLARHTGMPRLATWFLAALVFSLLGDIFLMLDGEHWFPLGLGAFLVAQICYIIGLNPTPPPGPSLWLLVFIVVVDWLVLRPVVRAAKAQGATTLQLPIVIYGVALSLTLFSGWATWLRTQWPMAGSVAASAGTTLFFASDLMLAWNKFVRPSRLLRMGVIVTYHLAQLALALTIWLHTLSVGG
jgi:uncharacterized membrane protein YhhN